MAKRKQNAWLLTWEWQGDHAAVEDRVAAILRPGLSERIVGEIVECLYAIHELTPGEMAGYCRTPKQNPHKAQWHNGHCFCGENPSLHANQVSGLVIEKDPETELETISWTLPPLYAVNPQTGSRETKRGPLHRSTKRSIAGPLSSREIGRYAPSGNRAG